MHTRAAFSLLIFVLGLSACDKPHERYRQPEDRTCVKRAIRDQFLVKYRDDDQVQRLHINRQQLDQLLLQDRVEWAEPNYRIPVPATPKTIGNIRSSSQGNPYIAAEYAWARGYTGQKIKIAVVDSGIDIDHPLLKKSLRRGSDEYQASPVADNNDSDGNGYVDDIYGWNFADNGADIQDETGHGTHIAGIISGAHNAFSQFRGIAPSSEIIAADFMNSDTGDEYNAIRAIDYALKRNVRIINNSWSNFCSTSLRSAFEGWQSHNVVFVNAAGNDGLYIDPLAIFPANLYLANAITVGSVGYGGQRSSFSNYGANVFLYAPGEDIFSLAVGNLGYDMLVARSGTSMSTAFVTGAVALAWSAYPEKSAAEIVNAIRSRTHQSQAGHLSTINVRELFEALRP